MFKKCQIIDRKHHGPAQKKLLNGRTINICTHHRILLKITKIDGIRHSFRKYKEKYKNCSCVKSVRDYYYKMV